MMSKIISVLMGVGSSVFLWFDSRDTTARHFGVLVVGAVVIGFVLLRALGIRG
jgi:hypothetical protein